MFSLHICRHIFFFKFAPIVTIQMSVNFPVHLYLHISGFFYKRFNDTGWGFFFFLADVQIFDKLMICHVPPNIVEQVWN